VAISSAKHDPEDVVFAVKFDCHDVYSDDYYDVEPVIVDEDCIKWDLTSGKMIDVECVHDILGMTIGYWVEMSDISSPFCGERDGEEDRGGLKYL